MALVFYYKDMLEKVTTQRSQQFSAFSLEEPGLMQRMRSSSKNWDRFLQQKIADF